MTLKPFFRDYDLSLVCVSKCEDDFLQCASTCSSADCLTECNRDAFVCGDCEYFFQYRGGVTISSGKACVSVCRFYSGLLFHIKHVHVILIALMAVKDATTQYASAT